MLDNVVSLILAQHAIMRGVEAQQTREMRIDVQPLRGEDAQHMRVRHQQHVMTGIEQRHHRVDRIAGARGGLLNRLARAIVHGTCSPLGSSTQSPSNDSGRERGPSRHTSHWQAASLAHLLACTPFGTAVIPFRNLVKHFEIAITSQLRGLLGATQGACEHAALVETIGERLTKTLARRTSLLATGIGQRNIGSAGMLARFAPHSLAMAQQYQAAGRD